MRRRDFIQFAAGLGSAFLFESYFNLLTAALLPLGNLRKKGLFNIVKAISEEINYTERKILNIKGQEKSPIEKKGAKYIKKTIQKMLHDGSEYRVKEQKIHVSQEFFEQFFSGRPPFLIPLSTTLYKHFNEGKKAGLDLLSTSKRGGEDYTEWLQITSEEKGIIEREKFFFTPLYNRPQKQELLLFGEGEWGPFEGKAISYVKYEKKREDQIKTKTYTISTNIVKATAGSVGIKEFLSTAEKAYKLLLEKSEQIFASTDYPREQLSYLERKIMPLVK